MTLSRMYQATFLNCSVIYLGASARPDNDKKGRVSEYESNMVTYILDSLNKPAEPP